MDKKMKHIMTLIPFLSRFPNYVHLMLLIWAVFGIILFYIMIKTYQPNDHKLNKESKPSIDKSKESGEKPYKTTFLNGAGIKLEPKGPGKIVVKGLDTEGGDIETGNTSAEMDFQDNKIDSRKKSGRETGGNLRIRSKGKIEANRNKAKKDIEIDGGSSVQANDNIAGHSSENSDK